MGTPRKFIVFYLRGKMKKLILALLASLALPAVAADKDKIEGFYTMDAMGCLILRECTEGVVEIKTDKDIANYYKKFPMPPNLAKEFNELVTLSNQIGVRVYLAPGKYFPPGHRGVYHTVTNNFYLNNELVKRYHVLMSVMRHEGWHAAQDCMAGSIKNSMIAIIKPEEDVPRVWRDIVEKTYPSSAVPWEAEAKWAGMEENMTVNALKACATGKMWEVYPPTPLTRQWLEENGYLK
jgi:hypothetical protein